MSLKSATIRYRYAKGSDNSIIDVHDLVPEKRRDLAPYSCLGCGGELVPNLGQIKAKHFSHKTADTCSRETYLHKLAKEGFLRIYTQCLAHESAFIFVSAFPAVCNHYQSQFGQSCKTEKVVEVDLTKHFKSIELEKPYSGFTPDILLSADDGSEVLFVEIAVSHKCEASKIKFGKRIIEIEITGEDDVAQILSGRLAESSPKITTYNFKKKELIGDICKGQCQRRVNLFVIYESKKSILLELPPAEALSKSRHRKIKHYEILGFTPGETDLQKDIFKEKVREAHFSKKLIKNCYLCRYHGAEGMEGAIFYNPGQIVKYSAIRRKFWN